MYPQQARKIFSAVSRPAGRLLATRSSPAIRSLSTYGESITYSGGQASEGQGGYYGSGGARKSILETEHRPEMLALSSDVENLVALMDEIQKLEGE
mmetsp:Transcript_29656/g.67750  ORF Transcript_29656/g.67750 Transcript_29656/m.67750 type:complete len:96 (-) Transcript_29656:495-782(-)